MEPNIVETEFTLNGTSLSYSVDADDEGYTIYLDGQKWIRQPKGGWMPKEGNTLAEKAVAHIKELVESNEEAKNNIKTTDEAIQDIEARLAVTESILMEVQNQMYLAGSNK